MRSPLTILGLVAGLAIALVLMAVLDAAWLGWVVLALLLSILLVQTTWEWRHDWRRMLGVVIAAIAIGFLAARLG